MPSYAKRRLNWPFPHPTSRIRSPVLTDSSRFGDRPDEHSVESVISRSGVVIRPRGGRLPDSAVLDGCSLVGPTSLPTRLDRSELDERHAQVDSWMQHRASGMAGGAPGRALQRGVTRVKGGLGGSVVPGRVRGILMLA